MKQVLVRIRGARGDWTADVQGERLAVIHDSWRKGLNDYFDPMQGVDVAGKRYTDLVACLRERDTLVVQRDAGGGDFSRKGYVGVFRFEDLKIGEDGSISLRIVARVADPRP